VWVALAIGNLALYLVMSFVVGILWGHPKWAEAGRWMMFTYTDATASVIEGEAQIDGGWVPFENEALFPTVWGSGVRFGRSADKPSIMSVVAASTCIRHPGTPTKVRFVRAVWDKQLGSTAPAGAIRRRVVLEWTCGDPIALPDGRTLP